MSDATVQLTVRNGNHRIVFELPHGVSLRDSLIELDKSPHRGTFRKINCGGNGICGSCKVIMIAEGKRSETRSCQIRCFQDLEIELE